VAHAVRGSDAKHEIDDSDEAVELDHAVVAPGYDRRRREKVV
jgi:hypothetical protein